MSVRDDLAETIARVEALLLADFAALDREVRIEAVEVDPASLTDVRVVWAFRPGEGLVVSDEAVGGGWCGHDRARLFALQMLGSRLGDLYRGCREALSAGPGRVLDFDRGGGG